MIDLLLLNDLLNNTEFAKPIQDNLPQVSPGSTELEGKRYPM